MTNINEFSSISSLSAADKLLVWSNENGDTRKASLASLMAYIESQFASPEYETVITAPTSSGFNIQMPAYTTNVWEIINPTGTFAAGTLTLPAPADCFDGQQVVVCTTQVITAFTLAGNGATTVGVPTSLGAGGFFAIRFNALQSTWYCTSQQNTAAASVQAFLTTPSSANLMAAVTDETGAGSLVFSTGPTLTNAILNTPTLITPNIGAAYGTSVSTDSWQRTTPVAVASLTAPATAGAGARHAVNNSNATLTAGIGAVVAGGGANVVPVFCDGVNWRIG